MGKKRREVHGPIAFVAWLGVHAMLMTGIRTRVAALIDWGWAYLSSTRGPQVLDRETATQIDWSENGSSEPAEVDAGHPAVPPDVGRNPLQRHDRHRAGVLCDPGLLGGDDVHDHAAPQHLGQPPLDPGRTGAALVGHGASPLLAVGSSFAPRV